MKQRLTFLVFLVIIALPTVGEERGAKELYEKGLKTLHKGFLGGDPEKAIEIFRKVIDIYPDSRYAISAELGIADAYFKKKEYRVAVDLYREFLEKRPDYPKADYIMYQIGRCFCSLTPAYDRDLTPAKNGISYLRNLINHYPDSRYVKPAKKMLDELMEKIARREIYVGNFYIKDGDIASAKKHFLEAKKWAVKAKTLKEIERYLKKIEEWENSE